MNHSNLKKKFQCYFEKLLNVAQGVAHDEKSIFFIFCLKVPYGGPRNVVVFFY